MNFKGRKVTASMTSEVKSDVRFELNSPDYPQVSILEAVVAI